MLRSYLPPSWCWFEMAGPDARDYLHRVTTVDVNGLKPGQGAPGCLLTGHGKLRAWFWLWQMAPDRYGFELDGGADGKWKAQFIEAIEQLHFAENFTVSEPFPNAPSAWIFADGEVPNAPGPGQWAMVETVPLLNHGSRDFGRNWIVAWGSPEATAAVIPDTPQPVDFGTVEGWRIGAVRPRVETEIDENTIPLEVGLIDALATGKGCYPGQEVIERTISLGSPARRLAMLEFDGKVTAGESLLLVGPNGEAGPEIGKITSAVSRHALALVRKTHAKEGTAIAVGTHRGKIAALAPFKAE